MKTINFRYHLDKSSKKFVCPQCGKRTFVKYKDAENNFAGDSFGRCDREGNCGYIQYPVTEEDFIPKTFVAPIKKPQVYFPEDVFVKTLENLNLSDFYRNMAHLGIHEGELTETFKAYKIGALTNGKYKGAVTFPFIDKYNKVHSVQVKMFDQNNKTKDQNWLHSILYYHFRNTGNIPKWLSDYYGNDKKTNCLFGEHLLPTNEKDIVIVESPKNAIYGALFFTEFLWLASGSLSTLNAKKLQKLNGRNVLLVPDTSKDNVAFQLWEAVAQEAKAKGINVKMFDFLESITTAEQKEKGFDIADLITAELMKPKAKSYEDYTREERVQFGLSHFKIDDLKDLATDIFAGKPILRNSDLIEALKNTGLSGNDIDDLLDILCIRKIITAIDYPNYKLN